MKTRNGFVSNSSSSSFIVIREKVTKKQEDHIRNHISFAKLKKWDNDGLPDINESYAWDVTFSDDRIELYTFMDNFRMGEFLKFIGVPDDAIVDETEYEWH